MSSRRRKRDRPDAGALQAFAVECPACRTHAAVARSLVGRAARCPSCTATFLVPTPESAEAPVNEPLVFSEPPPPSTRRAAEEPHPTAVAPDAAATTTPFDTAGDDAPTSSPLEQSAAASTPPTTDSTAADGLAFHDPVKMIRVGGAEIELRRLTPEEKRIRRARRNVLILLVGAALLVALAVILGGHAR
jgi:hypothetical protein